MAVGEGEFGVAEADRLGEGRGGRARVRDPFRAPEAEARAFLGRGGVEPFPERAGAHDVRRHGGVEERGEPVGVEELGAPVAHGALLHLVEEPQVLRHGRGRLREFAEDESVQQEEPASGRGVDAAVVAAARVHDDESVERHLLGGAHEAALGVPFRVAVAVPAGGPGDVLDPARVDGRARAGEEPRRVDELAGHDPLGGAVGLPAGRAAAGRAFGPAARGALREDRARVEGEADAVRAAVVARLGVALAEAREETRHERAVERVGSAVVVFDVEPEAPGEVGQLADEVAPLAHLRIGEICLGREPAQLRLRKRGAFGLPPAPELERAEEVRAGDAEGRVRLVGLLLLVDRPPPRVVAAHGGDERDRGGKRRESGGREEHAREARLDGDARELSAGLRQRDGAVFVRAARDRAELEELAEPGVDHGGTRRVDEGEALDRAEAQVEHREDDAGERGAEHLGRRVGVAAVEVLLGVEADADAGAETSAPSRALARGCLRDGFDLQALHLRAVDVARDAREARVDDGADPRDRDGGLGDVGREDDAPARRGAEGALLLGGGQRGEEGDDVVRLEEGAAPEVVGGLADVALAGEEDEDVVVRGDLPRGRRHVARQVLAEPVGRPVAQLDGEEPPGHGHRRRAVEERRELLGVERRRGDDDLEVAAAREDALEDAEEEVDVERALVRFVNDDRVVRPEEGVAARFGEQHAVGHELHARLSRNLAAEAVLVADESAEGRLEFLRDAFGDGDGGEAARLRAGDAAPVRAAPELQGHLRQLGRLARAGVAADDDDGTLPETGEDLLAVRADREFLRIVERDVGFGFHARTL